jgi:hypothetical protein
MASNINPNNVDGTYPVAGQDNDSQGFRTNFTNIRNNFTNAKSEIEDLQGKVIVKSALSGVSLDNDMAGTVLAGAQLKDTRESLVNIGTAGGSQELSHRTAHNYVITTNASVTISFAGFPAAGTVGRIRFEITVSDLAHTLTLPSTVTKGTDSIPGYDSGTDTITFDELGTYHFEFWTDDGGSTVHIEDKTRTGITKHVVQRTPANTGQAGDVAGMVAVDADYMYICTADYDGSTVIWKRASFSAY